jgi:hypothetical protein
MTSTSRTMLAMAGGAIFLLAGCNRSAIPPDQARKNEPEAVTVDIPQPEVAAVPGTTPMAQRVAVIGVLNKRNGIERDLTMKPGQAFRVGDVIVRLRACETTAPWEAQKLTGAFVQVDVRNPQDKFERVFSGWLYKETPSINVVEHPVFDVWPKSCAMTHPEAGALTVKAESAASNRSSASKSTPGAAAALANDAAPAAAPPAPPTTAGDKAADSKAR